MSTQTDKIRALLGDAQHHLSNNRIGEVCIAIDQAIAELETHPKEGLSDSEIQKFAHDFCGKWATTYSSHDNVAAIIELRMAVEKLLCDKGLLAPSVDVRGLVGEPRNSITNTLGE